MKLDLDALHAEAASWVDTPWVPNSESKGFGVSCHNLPRAIYVACGLLPESFPRIVGDPTQDRYATISRMEVFLNGRPEFMRVGRNDIQPGDLLGLRICRVVDHLGVALGAGLFIHVLMHKHVSNSDHREVPPWQQRINAVWRIK